MLPAFAGILTYFEILNYPQRTQKTQKITGLAASTIRVTLPSRPERSDGLKYFSAKDAKDAKYFQDDGFGAGNRYAITACIF
jgi:hypothetical protein